MAKTSQIESILVMNKNHSSSYIYQWKKMLSYSECEIAVALQSARSCDAPHWEMFNDHYKEDMCLYLLNDHINIRWLLEQYPRLANVMVFL
jgi:hypothetical protein